MRKKRRQRGQVKMLDSTTARIRVPLPSVAGGNQRPYHNETLYQTTEPKAWKRVTEILAQVDRGAFFLPTKKTLTQFFPDWLKEKRRDGARAISLHQYDGFFRRYIEPTLGDKSLPTITPLDIRAVYNRLQDKGLSQKTLDFSKVLLRMIFSDARLTWRLVRVDPTDGVKLPKSRAKKREKHVLTPTQAAQMLSAYEPNLKDLMVIFMLYTGLRPSEISSLQVPDLSVTDGHGLVSVTKRTVRLPKQWNTEEPKSEKGIRSISFPLWLYEAIMQAVRSDKEKIWAGSKWEENGLLFPAPNGKHQDRGCIAGRLGSLLRRAGLPLYFTPYSLRYTYASLMYLAGEADKTVSEQMGHASVGITHDVYTQLFPMIQRAASDRLDRMIRGANESERVM